MLISAFISLIISATLLNAGLIDNVSALSAQEMPKEIEEGKVLGIIETESEGPLEAVFVDKANDLDRFVAKTLDEAKGLSLPQLPQPAQLDQPIRRLPVNPPTDDGFYVESIDIELMADNGAVLDCDSGGLLFEKRPDRTWPIASITKLVTALVFLDINPGWDKVYEVRAEDKRNGGRVYLFPGDKVWLKDLFYFSLVGSDNTATMAMVNATGLTEEQFVAKMNEKMDELGLKHTYFYEPTGLSSGNVSTAREIVQFSQVALAQEEISKACSSREHSFFTLQNKKRIIYNTNDLLLSHDGLSREGIDVLAGKTGYIDASGYCLVGKFKNKEGREIISAILGADSHYDRFSQTEELVRAVYKNYP